ncbi:MAG: hypothetical protein H6736_20875 [Alphaproteobacteria bacterium]|nr:hypothetical protein [Alphaproteobacteria bacterium]
MDGLRALHRHLCRPLPQQGLLDALASAPLRSSVRSALLEVPTRVYSRADPILEGAVARAVRHARFLGVPDDPRFDDPAVLRASIQAWTPSGPMSPHQRRRRSRLIAHVTRGLERLEARQGVVAAAWGRWVDADRAAADPDALAVAGVGIANRSAPLAATHASVENALSAMRSHDAEVVASGYATRATLHALDDAAWGRWVGRRATWIAELPRDHHYQWAVVGLLRALALRDGGGLLELWCPPPARYWRVSPSWDVLPTPQGFFAGERCTRSELLAAGTLPPEWETSIRAVRGQRVTQAFLDGFLTTSPPGSGGL